MGNFIVLSDSAVHEILISLSRDEINEFRDGLAKSLEEFSIPSERAYTPEPSVVTRPNAKTLFRPFTSSSHVGVKIIVDPSVGSGRMQGSSASNKATLHGLMALCDKDGLPVGIINADEITAYRTSLSVMVPYAWREKTARMVVFGAGKQALWHIRLALALRGSEIEHIAIVNRSAERGRSLLAQVKRENELRWKLSVEISIVEPTRPEYEQHLANLLADADVVFCTTPSTKPLFPSHYLTGQQAKSTGCYVSSIGSWQPEMIELDPQMLKDVVNLSEGYNPRGGQGGAVIVDDREGVLKDSGEVIRSHLGSEQFVEVGEILNLRTTSPNKERLERWLANGFIIYKSIGVGTTDLAAGTAILSLARKRGLGFSIPEF